jgi:hypothetical protein
MKQQCILLPTNFRHEEHDAKIFGQEKDEKKSGIWEGDVQSQGNKAARLVDKRNIALGFLLAGICAFPDRDFAQRLHFLKDADDVHVLQQQPTLLSEHNMIEVRVKVGTLISERRRRHTRSAATTFTATQSDLPKVGIAYGKLENVQILP